LTPLISKVYTGKYRNEKGLEIDISKGSFAFELYSEYWNKTHVIMKSTQCGISLRNQLSIIESSLKVNGALSNFTILPTDSIKNRYVDRFNEVIANSSFKQSVKDVDNKSNKKIDGTLNTFVYSYAENQFYEFPADRIVYEEIDVCDQDNIKKAKGRLGYSLYGIEIKVSNPTILNFGIHSEYLNSDQREWHIKCEACGHWINPDFFKHVVKDGYVMDKEFEMGVSEPKCFCDKCGRVFNPRSAGEWIRKEPKKLLAGFHINKMFSGRTNLSELVLNWKEGLTNESKMQYFYNSDLGLPFTSSGQKITKELIDSCVHSDYILDKSNKAPCVMGVDVGKVFHCVIMTPDFKILYIGHIQDTEELLRTAQEYNVRVGVIDAMPEIRTVSQIQGRHAGFFKCSYQQMKEPMRLNGAKREISVDRTAHMDTVKENFVKGRYILPANASSLDNGDFYSHLQSSTRIVQENSAKWVETSADHYFHALAYCTLANQMWIYINKLK
jgi:hypothetical protein